MNASSRSDLRRPAGKSRDDRCLEEKEEEKEEEKVNVARRRRRRREAEAEEGHDATMAMRM